MIGASLDSPHCSPVAPAPANELEGLGPGKKHPSQALIQGGCIFQHLFFLASGLPSEGPDTVPSTSALLKPRLCPQGSAPYPRVQLHLAPLTGAPLTHMAQPWVLNHLRFFPCSFL
jgi:hypothetical protein